MKLLLHLKSLDWILIIVVLVLVGIGLLSIYSASFSKGDFLNFKKQIIFAIAGFFLMILLSFFDWQVLRENPYLILTFYCLCIFALLGLFFIGPEIRGARVWYKLGILTFDPLEFSNLVLVILLAKYFSMRHVEMYRIRHIILSGFYVFLPAVLAFRQPNLGAVLILIAIWIGILIISGIKLRHFLILMFVFLLTFILSWSFLLKDYQRERIISFLLPEFEPLGIGWSQSQAKIAIGSGGVFGQGLGHGSQTQYGFLPETQTDFTFAAIAEELGLIGVGIIFILFSVLIWRIMRIAFLAKNNFVRLFASGFVLILMSQIFIHIGMNLGLLPIIGISLPLLSYGGSSLITLFIGFGILQSIKKDLKF